MVFSNSTLRVLPDLNYLRAFHQRCIWGDDGAHAGDHQALDPCDQQTIHRTHGNGRLSEAKCLPLVKSSQTARQATLAEHPNGFIPKLAPVRCVPALHRSWVAKGAANQGTRDPPPLRYVRALNRSIGVVVVVVVGLPDSLFEQLNKGSGNCSASSVQ